MQPGDNNPETKGSGAAGSDTKSQGSLRKIWTVLTRPSSRYSFLTLALGGFAAGIIFWGGFNTVIEATNTLGFCVSCHEMEQTVYQEYKQTIHHASRSGVRAICSDCHVPRAWGPKMIRKIQASNELFHKLMGTIDTPQKFEARRLAMAERVWASMKKSDSLECRQCHTFTEDVLAKQKPFAAKLHRGRLQEGLTCIDCHQGIAHKLPEEKPEAAAAAAK